VFVTLSCRNCAIYLSVEDDGKGFDYDALDGDGFQARHLRISIMKEKAQFKRTLRVEASPSRGNQIVKVRCVQPQTTLQTPQSYPDK
jgi:nitrate/nitrite-specific signal transduction histidine kinase